MNEEIGVEERHVVLVGVEAARPRVRRMDAHAAQQRTQFPDVRSDDELSAQVAAEIGREGACDSTVFENAALTMHPPADDAHGATGADGGGQGAVADGDRLFIGDCCRNGSERDLESGEILRQMPRAEALQRASVQEFRPEDAPRELREVAPAHSGRDSGANHAARAGAGDEGGPDTGFGQSFIDADVGQASGGTAAQGQSDPFGPGEMKIGDQFQLYSGSTIHQRMERLAEFVRSSGPPHVSAPAAGRSAFTRSVDAVLIWVRRHARPVHRRVAWLLGAALFGYVWLLVRTTRLVDAGPREWPTLPERCVLAIWHGCAPSLLVAIAKRKPRPALVILISTEPRGDALHVLLELLGFRVIRGDSEHHGWPSLARVAEAVAGGACAVITPDGGAPRGVARAGVVALAAAVSVPVVAAGVDCRPGIAEPHKWDRARNPLPFGRIGISIAEPLIPGDLPDAAALESARQKLQQTLDEAQERARRVLGLKPEE